MARQRERLIQTILVPIDFSEASRAALDYAADLARTFDASVDALHVWEAPSFTPHGMGIVIGEVPLDEVIRKGADEAMVAFVAEARSRGIAVRSARVERGRPAHSIVDLAKAGNYDLIVIGTHGRTGLPSVLLGSVAENVVRHAHCPVLSVRSRESSPTRC